MAKKPDPAGAAGGAAPVMPAIGGSRTLEDMEEIAHGRKPAFPDKPADPQPAESQPVMGPAPAETQE